MCHIYVLNSFSSYILSYIVMCKIVRHKYMEDVLSSVSLILINNELWILVDALGSKVETYRYSLQDFVGRKAAEYI